MDYRLLGKKTKEKIYRRKKRRTRFLIKARYVTILPPTHAVHWPPESAPWITTGRANKPGYIHARGTIQEFLISVRPTFEIHFNAGGGTFPPLGNADNEFGSRRRDIRFFFSRSNYRRSITRDYNKSFVFLFSFYFRIYNYVKGKERVSFSKSKRKDKEDLRGRVLFRKPCRNRDETRRVSSKRTAGKDFPKEIHFPDGEREKGSSSFHCWEYRATARHGNRESIYRDDSYQLPASFWPRFAFHACETIATAHSGPRRCNFRRRRKKGCIFSPLR